MFFLAFAAFGFVACVGGIFGELSAIDSLSQYVATGCLLPQYPACECLCWLFFAKFPAYKVLARL